MTSWLNARITPKIIEKTSLLFETSTGGFCSQFNEFVYAYLYALSEKKGFVVNDMRNAISTTYPLIKNTFATPSDIIFTDSYMNTATPMNRRAIQLRSFLNIINTKVLRTEARKVLQWAPELVERLENIIKTNNISVATLNVGVHMRSRNNSSREMQNISVDQYIQAVKKYQTDSKLNKLNVFVMSDSQNRLSELQKKKDPSLTIYTIANPFLAAEGHVQASFNAAPARTRMESYTQFMAELYVMQHIPQIFSTFTSNVGRFLYLTTNDTTRVVSLDTPTFVPV
jgi:hypothetical protein